LIAGAIVECGAAFNSTMVPVSLEDAVIENDDFRKTLVIKR